MFHTMRNGAQWKTSLDDCRDEAKALGEPLPHGSWVGCKLLLFSDEWGSSTSGSVMSHSQPWQLESAEVVGGVKERRGTHTHLYIYLSLSLSLYTCRILKGRGQQTLSVFFSPSWTCPLVTAGRWVVVPVCQRPTSPVHFDIHMGAVMILKAAIKLTVAFRGSAWCRRCAAPIIPSGNTP